MGGLTGKEMRAGDEPVVKELLSQRDGFDDDPETINPDPIKPVDSITDFYSSNTGETGMELNNAASVSVCLPSMWGNLSSLLQECPTQDIVIALPSPSGELIKKMKAAGIRTRGMQIQ